jgi:hypothetical protein
MKDVLLSAFTFVRVGKLCESVCILKSLKYDDLRQFRNYVDVAGL